MKRKNTFCCGKSAEDGDPATEIPEQIQMELDAIGGLEALASRIPPMAALEMRGRIYQAVSDPLRLSILYIIKDQPLCVCVINKFMRLSGSKLSYHLNGLKEAGLIKGEYLGNWNLYSITECGRRLLQCTEYAVK